MAKKLRSRKRPLLVEGKEGCAEALQSHAMECMETWSAWRTRGTISPRRAGSRSPCKEGKVATHNK